MESLELASWTLDVLTLALVIVIAAYAIITCKMLKSAKQTQQLLEEQNDIMKSHNATLKEQSDVLYTQVKALSDQNEALMYVGESISDLSFDTQEIRDKKMRG